jgi:hypothetical protein
MSVNIFFILTCGLGFAHFSARYLTTPLDYQKRRGYFWQAITLMLLFDLHLAIYWVRN